MSKEKQFLTSVADVILIDESNDTIIMNGKSLINSSMSQAIRTLWKIIDLEECSNKEEIQKW